MDMDREDIINGLFNLIMDRPSDALLEAMENESKRAQNVRQREMQNYMHEEYGVDNAGGVYEESPFN